MDLRFKCPNCGQSLESPDDMAGQSTSCPKCNKAFVIPYTPRPGPAPVSDNAVAGIPCSPLTPKTSGLAVASMVLGVLGLMGGWMCCGIVLPLLPIIFGHIAYSKVSRDPTALTGKGFAIAGFTLGYIGLMFGIVMSLVLGTFVAGMGTVAAALGQVTNQLQQTGGYHH